MINKLFALEDLKETGLKIVGSYVASDTKIGEYYLQPSVISMWDFTDYSEYYTYFDDGIKLVVNICVKTDDKTTKSEILRKDLSNLIDYDRQALTQVKG